MNRTALRSAVLPFAALAGVLLLALPSCDSRSVDAGAKPAAAAAPTTPAPTAARVAARSADRWQHIAKKEWIEAYDFLTPDQKASVSLANYLQGKQYHEYANPRVGEVLKIQKDAAYVRVSALWTPHHPQLAKVKLEPGQSLTEEIDMIETWRFVGGDWYYLRAQNEEEFFQQHADLLKKSGDAQAGAGKTSDANSTDAPPADAKSSAVNSSGASSDAKSSDTPHDQPK